ncbi:MAG: hypothetical protein HYT61_03040 [Candidatus Yanofskybacteria bacterium]|nr:hypothetical protein [Candidatus Yanofskybacteria bacterium]
MPTKIGEEKNYLCAICRKNQISKKRICELFEGGGGFDGDIFGFDPISYTDYRIEGGKLFAERPDLFWESDTKRKLDELLKTPKKEPPIGGICTECLKNPIVLSLMEHIQFENKSR